MQQRSVAAAVNRPVLEDVPEGVTEECLEQWRCLAELVGHEVARALQNSPGSPVRPPSHACPPVRSIDLAIGVHPTTDYTVVAPGASETILERRLRPGHYATLMGWAWTVAWDSDASTGNAYLSTPVTLLVDGVPHPEYSKVTLPLTSSLAALAGLTVPIDSKNPKGALIQFRATNNHSTDSVRVAARLRGYEFPVAGAAEGILGGLVQG
ncbi:MAG: hypothetical protein ACF8XB_09730 [Planctomycetota bacterium JB042]